MSQDFDNGEAPRKGRGCFIFLLVAGLAFVSTVVALGYVLYSIEESRKIQAQGPLAIGGLRTINAAQTIYFENHKRYGKLKELGKVDYISKELAKGRKYGYKFEVIVLENGQKYWVKATPLNLEHHERHFFSNHELTVYFSLKNFEVDNKTCLPTTKLQAIGGH